MDNLVFYQPERLLFGEGSFVRFVRELNATGLLRLLVLTVPFLRNQVEETFHANLKEGITLKIDDSLRSEPGVRDFEQLLAVAREFRPGGIIGIGGGSILDLAKIVAAMTYNDQKIEGVFGIGLLKKRSLFLACLPTTSGTGSEVSPNSILMDESEGMKKGIISPHLVPDWACIDPLLTIGVPPEMTASTGMDALTHCIEAFTNKFAHPMVDLYALEGIRLIGGNLVAACRDGGNISARSALSMGSYYGGLCLGPVNTAAVHALSYPLGSRFKIPHGLANAVLLPYVMEYNLVAGAGRYSRVAIALGAKAGNSEGETAEEGVVIVRELMRMCNLPGKLSEIGIPAEAIDEMAVSAVAIKRLMKNNIREVSVTDAVAIYQKAY